MGCQEEAGVSSEIPTRHRAGSTQRERRAAAVARTAARVASEHSLPATLRALAHEILQADELAGVQVLTHGNAGEKLHMLGIAGFQAPRTSDFFARLMECRRRGAELKMLETFRTGQPVLVRDRYTTLMTEPCWEPLRDFHRTPRWEDFAAVPIIARGATIGVLNIFVAVGRTVDDNAFDFFTAMADQAGLAIDYACLLERERITAQQQERERLARDLHDSVVQQIFSAGMLTQTLQVLLSRENGSTEVHSIVRELEEITQYALADLRALVGHLRPSAVSDEGLSAALEKLAQVTHRQTGTSIDLSLGPGLDGFEEEFADDLYRIVAEAVHNTVKHSSADQITISLDRADEGLLRLYIRDNGGGAVTMEADREDSRGNGLVFMRQRIERWGGELSVHLNFGGAGAVVQALLPLPGHKEEHG